MKKLLIFSGIIFCIILCFSACSQTVTFDENGGELKTESMGVKYNDFYTLPIPKKTGYEFVGWYYGDTKVETSGNWPFKEDVTLVAKWEYLEYKIIYELVGGVMENPKVGYNSDSGTFTIPTPTRDRHLFSHWEDDYGNKYEEYVVEAGSTGDIYLTAVWWDFEENGVKYTYENDMLYVRTYDGTGDEEIVIPSELYGKKVTKISAGAFKNLGIKVASQNKVYRVYLPNTITYIGENAFSYCANVKVVLDTKSNDDYLKLATEWLETVEIEKEGNDYLEDVVLLKRPTFDSSEFVQIEE